MNRKHPKHIRQLKKERKKQLDHFETEVIDELAEAITIEIDREIIDNIKNMQDEEKTKAS